MSMGLTFPPSSGIGVGADMDWPDLFSFMHHDSGPGVNGVLSEPQLHDQYRHHDNDNDHYHYQQQQHYHNILPHHHQQQQEGSQNALLLTNQGHHQQDCTPFSGPSLTDMSDGDLAAAAGHDMLGAADILPGGGGRAWRPSAPCRHCKRLRLQCVVANASPGSAGSTAHSCSNCAALFRPCSLAETLRRPASSNESLNGGSSRINEHRWDPTALSTQAEEEEGDEDAPSDMSCTLPLTATTSTTAIAAATWASSRPWSGRSARRTQLLRDWYARNAGHPYPTDADKTLLAERSGLSRTQVINWFTNARRRGRQTGQLAHCRAAFYASDDSSSRSQQQQQQQQQQQTAAMGTSGSDSSAWSGSASSSPDWAGGGRLSAAAAAAEAANSNYNYGKNNGSGISNSSSGNSVGNKPRLFRCSYCPRAFSKKYDWLRHERCIHAPGDVSWTCAVPLKPGQAAVVWRTSGPGQPECVFCGETSPSEAHLRAHEFETCLRRAPHDRTFSRKDHMWQHLYKFHGCRKWEGWKPDLNLLQRQT